MARSSTVALAGCDRTIYAPANPIVLFGGQPFKGSSALLTTVIEFFKENASRIIPAIVAAVGSSIAGYLALRRWRRREFLHRLNVSLTRIDDGMLRIRTLLEMDCDDIFLNKSASKQIVKYAKRTTLADPILPIADEDCWNYLNAILNEVSERFSEGQIKRDMGLTVQSERYLLCLTCEKAGPVKTQKIRCMVVRKSLLTKLPEEEPQYESRSHSTRWQTLQHLAKAYAKRPGQFIEMEISV